MEKKRDSDEERSRALADLAASYLDLWEAHGAFPDVSRPNSKEAVEPEAKL